MIPAMILCSTLIHTCMTCGQRSFMSQGRKRAIHYRPFSITCKNKSSDDLLLDDDQSIIRKVQKICVGMSGIHEHFPIEEDISSRFSLPHLTEDSMISSEVTHCLRVIPYKYNSITSYAIGIQPLSTLRELQGRKKKSKSSLMQPVFVDFCPSDKSKIAKRLGSQGQKGELLMKAISPGKYGKETGGAVIYDLTAGFGQDSMVLASGKTSEIHMVERDPIVSLLLNDAMRRLDMIVNEDVERNMMACELRRKLTLHQEDSVSFCKRRRTEMNGDSKDVNTLKAPDICYLDPMFPPRTKSAAVKKNMQILHGLLHTNVLSSNRQDRCLDEKDLLIEALSVAKSRVVVKRPIASPPLGISTQREEKDKTLMPTFDLRGSINRFDVYILQ